MYSIFSTYAQRTVVFRPATSKRNADGDVFERKDGYRMRFTELGKSIDPDTGDMVDGIRRPGLAASQRARRNRALGELILSDVVLDMRASGFPDMTEKKLVDWWMEKYRGTKGIEWNLYYTDTGAMVPEEEIGLEEADAREVRFAASDSGDENLFEEIPGQGPKHYRCIPCSDVDAPVLHDKKGIVYGQGLNGHRRSNAHIANLKAFRKKVAGSQLQGAVAV